MGLGVAECFAAAGIRVLLTDATPELTREAKRRLVQRARGHADAGLLAEGAVGRVEAVETAPEVVHRLVEFLRSIGKRPAVVGDGPGFVANRIQNALFLEAVRCVEEGLASPQEVDEVVRSCFGFRLPFFGPFQISDMAGLDVYENVLDVLKEGLGERFEAPESLRKLVEGGRTGTKSGAGFLEYTDEERERLLLERDRRYAALNKLLEDLPPVDAGSGDSP